MMHNERALMSIQTLFNKYAKQIQKQVNLARDCDHKIELEACELLRSTFFAFRYEVEQKFAKLGLQRFCGLSAFKKNRKAK